MCFEDDTTFDSLDAPVQRVCGADVPMPYAANLEEAAVPQIEDVIEAVEKVCKGM